MKKIFLLLLFLPTIIPTTVLANVIKSESNTITNSSNIFLTQTSFNYQIYNNVLKTYVSDLGLVDYQKLQTNRQEMLSQSRKGSLKGNQATACTKMFLTNCSCRINKKREKKSPRGIDAYQ